MLENLRRGDNSSLAGGTKSLGKNSVEWEGLLRLSDDGTPSFYSRRYSRRDVLVDPNGTANNWAGTVGSIGSALAGGVFKTGLSKTLNAMIHGVSYDKVFMPSIADFIDKEVGDVNVHIGPAYFNFQQNTPRGWNLERYVWSGSTVYTEQQQKITKIKIEKGEKEQ
jgi:hypothetical protein